MIDVQSAPEDLNALVLGHLEQEVVFVSLYDMQLSVFPLQLHYVPLNREVLLLTDLGWVGLDLGCTTILPMYTAISAKFTSAQSPKLQTVEQPISKSTQPKFASRWTSL